MKNKTESKCKHLRTKMSYVPDVDNSEFWRSSNSTTHAYWCLLTMQPAGPDDGLVGPPECRNSRRCFEEKE